MASVLQKYTDMKCRLSNQITAGQLPPEQKFQQASGMIWPTKKHSGRTLGEVLQMDPTAINWLANKYSGNPEVSAAAKFMCEYAMSRSGA